MRSSGGGVRPWVPLALVWARTGLAAALVAAGRHRWADGGGLAAAVTAGLASDVYDGVLARRWGVATATLRRLDSVADVAFYAAALFAAWALHPAAVAAWAGPTLGLLAVEAAVQATSLVRWRAVQATHSWLAKAWGLALWAAFVGLLGFGRATLVPVALAVGYVADAEVLAILLLAPRPPVDVRSIAAAMRLRRAAH